MPGARKVPAIMKAPFDYLLALVICLAPIIGSIPVEPPLTRWIVFGVGIGMFLTVLAVAIRPVDA